MVYPGADEVGFTLLARAYNDYHQLTPKVYVHFASTFGPQISTAFMRIESSTKA